MDIDGIENELEMEKALEDLRKSMKPFQDLLRLKAKLQRGYFEDLIDQGFDRDEALFLCQYMFPDIGGGG